MVKKYDNFIEEVKVSSHSVNESGFGKGQSVSSEEEDLIEEPEEERAIPHFLVNLPGVTATDSMGYRIEALRVYLEI